MTQRIHLGISTCPNDTFAFHAILERRIDLAGFEFEIELLDVEELNRRLLAGDFDASKASFHAALKMTDELVVIPAGSALGFGVGPLLLASRPGIRPEDEGPAWRVLCPGEHTTGTLLYRLFHPGKGRVEQTVFSEIMPALKAGRADFGVCIHEGRFTWREEGLALVEDLGQRWEESTGCPLPLGGIVARRRLGESTLARLASVIRNSIEYGLSHRAETLPTMRTHAQSLRDDVLFAHVDLYVNRWTLDLGDDGRRALDVLAETGMGGSKQRLGVI